MFRGVGGIFQVACGVVVGLFVTMGICAGLMLWFGVEVHKGINQVRDVSVEIRAQNEIRQSKGLPPLTVEEAKAIQDKLLSGANSKTKP